MTNRETVRSYLTDELKDSTRGQFNLKDMSNITGLEMDDLMLALKLLVTDKVISIFELQDANDVVIELLL